MSSTAVFEAAKEEDGVAGEVETLEGEGVGEEEKEDLEFCIRDIQQPHNGRFLRNIMLRRSSHSEYHIYYHGSCSPVLKLPLAQDS